MPKFFIKKDQINDNNLVILGEDVNHIKNVLRKSVGDCFEVCNQDDSQNYLVEIVALHNDKIECSIIDNLENNTESNLFIHVFQGLPKADKMELIIQKGVELGASAITPVAMKRSIVKISAKDEYKKIQRWQKISEVAAKQCGRSIIPKINNIAKIQDICKIAKNYDIILVAYENEKENKLKYELQKLKGTIKDNINIAIVIGPEGGLEPDDVNYLKENGAKIITLGNRILRTETVALNMISVITYELEN